MALKAYYQSRIQGPESLSTVSVTPDSLTSSHPDSLAESRESSVSREVPQKEGVQDGQQLESMVSQLQQDKQVNFNNQSIFKHVHLYAEILITNSSGFKTKPTACFGTKQYIQGFLDIH